MPFLILILLALAFWIYAERRLRVGARIGGGMLCIVLVAFGAYFSAVHLPSERLAHRSSLRLTAELLSKGETQRVEQALGVYNSIAATSTTYRAAMEMWDVLNHGPKK